jgi:hypothetical protein
MDVYGRERRLWKGEKRDYRKYSPIDFGLCPAVEEGGFITVCKKFGFGTYSPA